MRGRRTLRTSPWTSAAPHQSTDATQNCMGRGHIQTYIYRQTLQLLDRIRETPNLSTYAHSSTNNLFSLAKNAKMLKMLKMLKRGVGHESNSEHLPVFRAPCEGKGRSAPVHGRGTLRTSPRTQKSCTGRGHIYTYIDRNCDYQTKSAQWADSVRTML